MRVVHGGDSPVESMCGDLHSTKDPAMDLYFIQMSNFILQSAILCRYEKNRVSILTLTVILCQLPVVNCNGIEKSLV
jgi:hypothetical protein